MKIPSECLLDKGWYSSSTLFSLLEKRNKNGKNREKKKTCVKSAPFSPQISASFFKENLDILDFNPFLATNDAKFNNNNVFMILLSHFFSLRKKKGGKQRRCGRNSDLSASERVINYSFLQPIAYSDACCFFSNRAKKNRFID